MQKSLSGREIKHILHRGKRLNGKLGTAYAYPIYKSVSLLGVVLGAKVGNAVKRNRIRRIFREAFRAVKSNLHKSVGIVIIPRNNEFIDNFWDVKRYLEKIISETNFLCKEKQ